MKIPPCLPLEKNCRAFKENQPWSTVGKVRNTNSLPICYELDPINKTTYASISKTHSHPETKFNFHFSFTPLPCTEPGPQMLKSSKPKSPGTAHTTPAALLTAGTRFANLQAIQMQRVPCAQKKFLTFFCLLFEGHSCTSRLSETIQAAM